ncbi:MAG: endolytic transglycosylase MltG, partial [Betaproteobacteria bacterium]|nr:endolytic transglycosylase MltG [Betaproteobacteria bacterium]
MARSAAASPKSRTSPSATTAPMPFNSDSSAAFMIVARVRSRRRSRGDAGYYSDCISLLPQPADGYRLPHHDPDPPCDAQGHPAMRLIKLGVLALALAAMYIAWQVLTPVRLAAPTVEFSIQRGSALRAATRQIVEAGVGVSPWQFNLIARLTSADTHIKAGSYAVSSGVTSWDILRKITQGDFTLDEVVIIEGWTFRQMRAALDAHPAI